MANDSDVLAPGEQEQVASALEHDAQVLSDAQLQERLAGRPESTQHEILRINDDARHLALQVALLVPIAAAALGFVNSLRMRREPAPQVSSQPSGPSVF
jgi:hypothetical protein